METMENLVGYIECHEVVAIQRSFKEGIDPNVLFRGEPLIFELTSEYTRGPRFTACVKAFVEAGLKLEDPVLPVLLLDSAKGLRAVLEKEPNLLHKKYTLRCAYTQMIEVSLLHLCAEFNLIQCARLLLDLGLEVDTPAGLDEYGFGGQTALFHTVNQNGNHSKAVFNLLLDSGANPLYPVKGLIWGKGYEWETFIPAVNPISYATMGLLPQMHRDEKTIAQVVQVLVKKAYGIDYRANNVPNRYVLE